MSNRIALFIPCYNEESRLKVELIKSFIVLHRRLIDFIFVDDGSSDETVPIIEKNFLSEENVFLFTLKSNKGKGIALREALLSYISKPYKFFGFIDADLDIPLEQIKNLYANLNNSKYLVAVSARNITGNLSINRLRSISSLLMVFLANKIIGFKPAIKDTQCGCKLFHRDVIEDCFGEDFISGWLFDIEIFLRLKKYKKEAREIICEVPLKNIEYTGDSRFEFRKNTRIIRELVQINRYYN